MLTSHGKKLQRGEGNHKILGVQEERVGWAEEESPLESSIKKRETSHCFARKRGKPPTTNATRVRKEVRHPR